MAKNFNSSFNDLFSPTGENKNSIQNTEENFKSPKGGGEIQRTTILLNKKTYETIKAIAHWERTQIKDLIDNALTTIIGSYSPEQLENMKRELAKSKSKR